MKAGEEMNYTIKRVDENKAVMEMEDGSKVTIIFREEDNPDIEDIVTNNLMMSYEARMKEMDYKIYRNKSKKAIDDTNETVYNKSVLNTYLL